MDSNNAHLFVYLQALGGKFLGTNAYNNNEIEISFEYSGGSFKLPYQVIASTNDGNISPVFTPGCSTPMPILTAGTEAGQNPTVNYLTANPNTIMGLSPSFALPATNELATLTITVPTPSGKNTHLQQSVWLLPEQQVYKLTIAVPGLLLAPNTPTLSGTISVYIKMMCGCKVSTGLPTSFWSPADFIVNANVFHTDGTMQQYPLEFDTETNDSLFVVQVQNVSTISAVHFYAQQMSTGNYGAVIQLVKKVNVKNQYP